MVAYGHDGVMTTCHGEGILTIHNPSNTGEVPKTPIKH